MISGRASERLLEPFDAVVEPFCPALELLDADKVVGFDKVVVLLGAVMLFDP